MGLFRDIFRGLGLGIGFNLSNDVYNTAKDVIVGDGTDVKEADQTATNLQANKPATIKNQDTNGSATNAK